MTGFHFGASFGPRAGQNVFAERGTNSRDAAFKQALCVHKQDLSIRAAVRCCADDRQAREQQCFYIALPVLANGRAQCNSDGQVVMRLETTRVGTTPTVQSPLEVI
jgi:hypothetical protein